MQTPESTLADLPNPSRGLRRGYIVALSAVALLIISSHVAVQARLGDQTGNARNMNIAGRQRALSQRIAKNALQVVAIPIGGGQNDSVSELKATLREFVASHRQLILDANRNDQWQIVTDLQNLTYFVRDINLAGEKLVADGSTRAEKAAAVEKILDTESKFLAGMEATLLEYERGSELTNASLRRLEVLLSGVAFIILILEAFLIFRPAEMTINRQFEALKRRIRETDLARERAVAAEQAKGEFLASMSHEIRTPLNGIIGMSTIVSESGLRPEQHEQMRTVLSCSHSLMAILNEILDFSKIEAGMIELERIPFDLANVVEDVAASFEVLAKAKGVEVLCHIEDSVPEMAIGDPTRVRQLVSNLVGNAVKFTEEGEVRIGATYKDGQISIRVADTGIGMRPETLEKIFHRFTQAERSTNRKYGGTGLGLAICQFLSEAMGGQIEVQSIPGVGSEFTMTMPLEAIASRKNNRVQLAEELILCVDDNRVNREVLTNYICALGGTPITTATAEEAFLIFKRQRDQISAVVLDMNIGISDGIELAKQLQKLSDKPMILLTSVLLASSESEEARSLFSSILLKPVRRSSLQTAILHAIYPNAATVEPFVAAASLERKLNVLVVEDNQVNQMVVQSILKAWGHSSTVATDGLTALSQWESGAFHVVLMDIGLPDINGLEVTRRIRAGSRPLSQIPIIGLTASALAGDREEALAAGMSAFLTKPIDREALRTELSRI